MSDPGPFGPDTDEALSAELDGELAGFAAEIGMPEEEVRARLDAWPGARRRRAELARAADRVRRQEPGDRLDTLTLRRLARTAAAAGPRHRHPVGTWAAAAVAALLVAIGGFGAWAWLGNRPSGTGDTAVRTADPSGSRAGVHLGTVPDLDAFALAVAARTAGVADTPGSDPAPTAEEPAATEGAGTLADDGSPPTDIDGAQPVPAVIATCATSVPGRLVATARDATTARRAFVATTARGRLLVYVLAVPGCRILEVRSVAIGTAPGPGR